MLLWISQWEGSIKKSLNQYFVRLFLSRQKKWDETGNFNRLNKKCPPEKQKGVHISAREAVKCNDYRCKDIPGLDFPGRDLCPILIFPINIYARSWFSRSWFSMREIRRQITVRSLAAACSVGCAKDRGIFCFHGIGQKVRFFHKLQKSSFRFTKRYSTVRVCLCRIASKKRKKWKKSFFQGWKSWPNYRWCMGVFLTSFLWLSWYRGSWVERVSKLSKGCVSGGGLVLRMPEQSLAYRYFAILLCCLLRVSLQLGIWILICEYY